MGRSCGRRHRQKRTLRGGGPYAPFVQPARRLLSLGLRGRQPLPKSARFGVCRGQLVLQSGDGLVGPEEGVRIALNSAPAMRARPVLRAVAGKDRPLETVEAQMAFAPFVRARQNEGRVRRCVDCVADRTAEVLIRDERHGALPAESAWEQNQLRRVMRMDRMVSARNRVLGNGMQESNWRAREPLFFQTIHDTCVFHQRSLRQ